MSFIDSGSNSIDFTDSAIPVCSSSGGAANFYCPSSTISGLTATNTGANGETDTATFSVANAAEPLQRQCQNATAFSRACRPQSVSHILRLGIAVLLRQKCGIIRN